MRTDQLWYGTSDSTNAFDKLWEIVLKSREQPFLEPPDKVSFHFILKAVLASGLVIVSTGCNCTIYPFYQRSQVATDFCILMSTLKGVAITSRTYSQDGRLKQQNRESALQKLSAVLGREVLVSSHAIWLENWCIFSNHSFGKENEI